MTERNPPRRLDPGGMRAVVQGRSGPPGVLAVVVLAVLLAGTVFLASAGTPSAAAELEWVLTKTEANPNKSQLPANATGGSRDGHIDWGTTVVPQAEFDVDFKAPPPRVKPGQEITITATARGRLTGEKTQQGFRWADVILYLNDRWVDNITSARVNCVDPIGAAPISCKESDSATGSATRTAPTYGDTFSIGVGVLNCGPCYVRYTYTARSTGAAPRPKPASGPKSVSLAISWSVPRRFGVIGADGLVEYPSTPKEISPASFRVDLVVRPRSSRWCKASDAITWKAGGALRVERTSGCRFSAYFAREGRYTLRASLEGRDGVTGTGEIDVIVQDWLIFGLGDSNGSGEGAPDIASPPLPARTPPTWHSLQCDRSANSYQAQAARSIENADPKTSVTFVHLSCSGASIQQGLLGAYEGINPGAGSTLDPQVLQMRRLAAGREIDAVIISIGVNDLGFAALVEHCILYPACYDRAFPNITSSKTTLAQVMKQRIDALPALYNRLSRSLKRLGIPAPNVYVTEYFDSTRDQNGHFCNPLIRIENDRLGPFTVLIPNPFLRALGKAAASVPLVFDQAEARWANEQVLTPLNAAVRAAATKHGWGLITGVAAAFRTHGYCSRSSWITGLFESLERQHDHNGTLHAKPFGNAQTAKLATKALREDLYPDGPYGPARLPKR